MSSLLFLSLFTLALLWPRISMGAWLDRVVPVEGTILLRAARLPHRWFGVAEVKAGNEDLPRGISSIEGRVVVNTRTRTTYFVASATALDRISANAKVISALRCAAHIVSPSGAYLLPLDSTVASERFELKLARDRHPIAEFIGEEGPLPDLLVVQSRKGFVTGMGAFSIEDADASSAVLPGAPRVRDNPLLWELLERIGKSRPWPPPDSSVDFLESLFLTKGEQLSERLASLKGRGEKVDIETLGGVPLELSRAQLRAIVSLYQ